MHRRKTTRAGGHLDIDVRALDPVALCALYELFGGDREALVELLDSFVEEAPQRLEELRRGADQGDAAVVGRAAHTLRSDGSTFGAVELASLCRRLEVAARVNELAGSADLIDRVEVQWARVRQAHTAVRDAQASCDRRARIGLDPRRR
jgi:HPt (histidine-containing phosphotransfer) domain-containing protein